MPSSRPESVSDPTTAGIPVAGQAGCAGLAAVIFDVDDTLVDTRHAFAVTLASIAERYLPHIPRSGYPELLRIWRADAGGHYRRFTRGEISKVQQRHARAAELHSGVGGPPLDEESFEEWNAHYVRVFRSSFTAFDDALPCVQRMRARGLAVGAVTNAEHDRQADKLRRSGLADLPLLVTMDTFGVGKPDPRVFAEACRILDVAPESAVYVGDEFDIDARAARAVGLRGVWLDRPGTRRGGPFVEDADLARAEGIDVIGTLDDLDALL